MAMFWTESGGWLGTGVHEKFSGYRPVEDPAQPYSGGTAPVGEYGLLGCGSGVQRTCAWRTGAAAFYRGLGSSEGLPGINNLPHLVVSTVD